MENQTKKQKKGKNCPKIKSNRNRNRQSMETAKENVLSLFFPRRCPVCQDIVKKTPSRTVLLDAKEKTKITSDSPIYGLICPECRKKISFVKEPLCKRCGKEILLPEMEYCYDCSTWKRSFQMGISLMNYDRIGRITMKAFKYQGRQEYASYYIEEILLRYAEVLRNFKADAIIPVPVHSSRRRKRGYNQAEVLAKELSCRMDIPLQSNILRRTRATTAQKNLNARERQRNLEKALAVRACPSRIKSVILIDDIYTTGSTAEACTRMLRAAGVRRICILTVCIGKNE